MKTSSSEPSYIKISVIVRQVPAGGQRDEGDGHNDERAARNLPYFSFKTGPTLNLTLPVSYWLKFYTKTLAENHEPIVQ